MNFSRTVLASMIERPMATWRAGPKTAWTIAEAQFWRVPLGMPWGAGRMPACGTDCVLIGGTAERHQWRGFR